MISNNNINNRFNALVNHIKMMKSVIVTFSGGVDSSLLLYAAKIADIKLLAITFNSYLYDKNEIEAVKEFYKKYDIDNQIINIDILNEIEELRYNPKTRCYLCKKYIYKNVENIRAKKRFNFILDGTNADDMTAYRPGLIALEELNILSPLAKLNFSKNEIRAISKYLNLSTYNKQSLSCFLTRFEYNSEITMDQIRDINRIETYLYNLGLKSARCRVHNKIILRIELDTTDMTKLILLTKDIIHNIKGETFKYITIDIEGLRSGSMDIV